MCIIAICKERPLTQKEIKNCWENNNHGAGIAWKEGRKIHYKKGFMTLSDFEKFYEEVKYKIPHIVHFRKASVGAVCKELTHPFELGLKPNRLEGVTNKVLFHNGSVSDWEKYKVELLGYCLKEKKPLPEGKLSDTRLVAILAGIMNLKATHLEFFGGKWVIFTPRKIEYIGDFISENGILFSNSDYARTYSTYYYGYGVGTSSNSWRRI